MVAPATESRQVSNAATSTEPLLSVDQLTTVIHARKRTLRAVDRVSFSVGRGEILGVVGESGCGKSMTALSIMRLLPQAAEVSEGSIRFDGRELLKLNSGEMRRVRGNDISMVFQEPMTALDPAFTIGSQITEVIHAHESVGGDDAMNRAIRMLERLGIPNAGRRVNDYPHQFSGGMRQRVMLALALIMNPKLLLADEPTTALDVTIQAQILELISQLRSELGLSVVLITHNLGVVNEIADRVAVMYAGEIVETGGVKEIFANPKHPYTQGLLRSMPYLTARQPALHVIPGRVPELWAMPRACRFAARCPNRIQPCVEQHPILERSEQIMSSAASTQPNLSAEPLIAIQGLTRRFPVAWDFFGRATKWVSAVDDVSLEIRKGETLALVGESGSGKSTLARLLLRLIPADGGVVNFQGTNVLQLSSRELRSFRQQAQIIFQDPYESLDPRFTAAKVVAEGMSHLALSKAARQERIREVLNLVHLPSDAALRFPHEFSGGQRQRVSIARALAVDPTFIVADEPVSALDVSMQSQILNLMRELQERLGLTYLFISHDMSVVRHMADRVAVMYLGRVVEIAPAEELFSNPLHPYTQALLSSVPSLLKGRPAQRIALPGEASAMEDRPNCRFANRCFRSLDICRQEQPRLDALPRHPDHWVACFNTAPLPAEMAVA